MPLHRDHGNRAEKLRNALVNFPAVDLLEINGNQILRIGLFIAGIGGGRKALRLALQQVKTRKNRRLRTP